MPLIRRIRTWFGRRISNATMYGTTAADGGASISIASQLWLVAFIVLIPVLAALVLIGLIYELIIRIDRGRALDSWTLWTLSGIAALCLVAAVGTMLIVYLA